MLPLVQGLKTVPAYILSHGFANTQLLVAVDQLSRRCFCRPPRPYAECGGLAELTAVVLNPVSLPASHGTLV